MDILKGCWNSFNIIGKIVLFPFCLIGIGLLYGLISVCEGCEKASETFSEMFYKVFFKK